MGGLRTTGWLKPEEGGVSEDFYFFEQARLKGYKVLVDTACVCKHEGTVNLGEGGNLGFTEI